MRKLENRIAIVTGASKGIGGRQRLHSGVKGRTSLLPPARQKRLEAVVDQIRRIARRALAVTADLGVETDIGRIADETLTRFGRVDILVNNAAIIHPLIDLVDLGRQSVASGYRREPDRRGASHKSRGAEHDCKSVRQDYQHLKHRWTEGRQRPQRVSGDESGID